MNGAVDSNFGWRMWWVVVAACAFAQPLGAQTDSQRELESVRGKIQALEAKLVRTHAARDANGKALATAERKLAAAQAKLADIQGERRRELEHKHALDAETRTARARLGKERAALAEQLRLGFTLGREPFAKLLLSQKDPGRLGRMLVYYQYFNTARTERIGAASAELGTLARLSAESTALAGRLAALEREQSGEVEVLERARAERRTAIQGLEQSIATTGSEIERLRGEAERLETLIEELNAGLEDFPVSAEKPFASLQGQLAWPVPGRVLGDYGAPRAGGVRWNGVLLEAAAGTPVRAIYHGRVAFADWLPGLGLLMIVDHGGGYMSLYGHNEALLKDSGDWVEPGEIIGQVGDTGGQAQPALYFEIRRDGRPVNPHAWMKGRPDGG